MVYGQTYVGVVLRPGHNNKWRVAPIATYEGGMLIIVDQVEYRRPNSGWEAASPTWQSLLLWEGKDAVKEAVISNGGCFVQVLN